VLKKRKYKEMSGVDTNGIEVCSDTDEEDDG